jgi:hypothetical protein
MVVVASRRVTVGLRPRDLVVPRLTWRPLDFLVCVATCGLLGVLVSVASPIGLLWWLLSFHRGLGLPPGVRLAWGMELA